MNKLLILISFLVNVSMAVTLDDLLNNDACKWLYNPDRVGVGCPNFFKKKCRNVDTKWSLEKVSGKDVAVFKWTQTEASTTGIKLEGVAKFVITRSHDRIELSFYEVKFNCLGAKSTCATVQEDLTASIQRIIKDKKIKNPAREIWNKTFAVDIDSTEYYSTRSGFANGLAHLIYDIYKERKIPKEKWSLFILNTFFVPIMRDFPCIEE